MKRIIAGALLSLALVGEITVGAASGLFSPTGFVVLAGLYICYFMLLNALVAKFKPDNVGIVLINFALYAVLITGLLHGELADYVIKPEHATITTLIRIQCSLFPLFVLYLLRTFKLQGTKSMTVKKASSIFILFVFLISFSETFGVRVILETFKAAPIVAATFSVLAVIAFCVGLKRRRQAEAYDTQSFKGCAIGLLLISLIPELPAFLTLLMSMIVVSVIFLSSRRFRVSSVV